MIRFTAPPWRALTPITLLLAGGCSDPFGGPDGPPRYGGVTELYRVEHEPGFRIHKPALDGTRLYADLNAGAGVVALDRETGAVIWHAERPSGGPSSLNVERGRILFVGSYAVALDAATGTELWRFEPDSTGYPGGGALGESDAHDGAFYFGTDHRIYALDAEDGSLLWKTEVGPEWEYRSIVRGVSVGGDTVYASIERYLARNGHLSVAYVVALDRHTGTTLWTFAEGAGLAQHAFMGGPRVAGEWLLIADYHANTSIALDRMSGRLRWRAQGDQGYFGAFESPHVSNDTVFTASADLRVTAFELDTGTVLWSSVSNASFRAAAPCGSRILAVKGGLQIFDRRDGRPLADLYDPTESLATLWVSRFAVDGNQAYVLGNRHAFAYQCPD